MTAFKTYLLFPLYFLVNYAIAMFAFGAFGLIACVLLVVVFTGLSPILQHADRGAILATE